MGNGQLKWFASVIGVLIIVLLFSFTQTLRTTDGSKSFDEFLNVAMPRPIKEMILGFSLEGRSVIREIEAAVIGVPAALAKKPTANGTKAVVDKGQKTKVNAAMIAAAKARAQLNERRRRAFEARIIEQADRYRESLKAKAETDTYENYENEVGWKKQDAKANNQGNPEKDLKEETDKMTAAEWKSLILAQPTVANTQKMIKAISSGDIDVETYLEISETLIKDNSQEKRKMGIWALTSIYRQEAFVVAAHLATETDTATQKTLTDYMYNYNRAQTLGVFDQILKSQDAVAAAAAAQSISKAIQSIQASSGQDTNQRNGSRNSGGTVQQLTMGSYKRLIPTLQYVVSKNLNNLSQWAQTLISQLQTIATTA